MSQSRNEEENYEDDNYEDVENDSSNTSSREEQLQEKLSKLKELKSALLKRNEAQTPFDITDIGHGWGMPKNTTSVSAMVRSIPGGVAEGSQKLASAMGEAGQYLGNNPLSRYLGSKIPDQYKTQMFDPSVNIREQMGLEGNNQVDLGKMIAGKNPHPALMFAGQYGLPTLAGGSSFLRQLIGQTAYNTTQASPQQENAFGYFPSGRPGAAMETALLGALPGIVKPLINPLINMFHAPKAMNALLEHLSGGKNSVQNIQELSHRLKYASGTTREEALIPKKEVMKTTGEKPIVESETIAPAEAGGIPERKITGEYAKRANVKEHGYAEELKTAHNNYMENPSLFNSHVLRSRLFRKMRSLEKARDKGALVDDQLDAIRKNWNAIKNDQGKFAKTLPKADREKYGKYNEMWRTQVRAYDEAHTTIKNMKNGFLEKVTPQKITNAFQFPELNTKMQSILKDIGPEGINNILYNAIGRTTGPEELMKLINTLEKEKGFSPYITPEIRTMIDTVRKTIRNRKMLSVGHYVAGGAATWYHLKHGFGDILKGITLK